VNERGIGAGIRGLEEQNPPISVAVIQQTQAAPFSPPQAERRFFSFSPVQHWYRIPSRVEPITSALDQDTEKAVIVVYNVAASVRSEL
jgi:hypothetical protein